MIKFSWLRLLLGCSSFVLTSSKCLVREPQGVTSPSLHGDSGFALAINSNPEYYEEHNLYTITLKVSSYDAFFKEVNSKAKQVNFKGQCDHHTKEFPLFEMIIY